MSSFFAIVKLLPAFIALIKEVLALVQEGSNAIETEKKVREFTKATQTARQTGDTSHLESLFGGSAS